MGRHGSGQAKIVGGADRSGQHRLRRRVQPGRAHTLRSDSTSTRRWVTASINTVAYLRPRLIAKSSTPSTATEPTSGSGSACTQPQQQGIPASPQSQPSRQA